MYRYLFLSLLALSVAAPASALEIAGGVSQTAKLDNVVNIGVGVQIYARQDINTVYDRAKFGGHVEQSTHTGNVVNFVAGVGMSSCQTKNSLGQRDCRFR